MQIDSGRQRRFVHPNIRDTYFFSEGATFISLTRWQINALHTTLVMRFKPYHNAFPFLSDGDDFQTNQKYCRMEIKFKNEYYYYY